MASNRFLLKNGTLPDGSRSDLLIADGLIKNRAENIVDTDATVIDIKGLVILPGLVDLHTHLREPGRELSLIHI
jgi:dihydroorotase